MVERGGCRSEYLFARKFERVTTVRNFEVDVGGHVAWASKCISLFF